ncbi:vWA domain-containing protein [Desulfogranum japonicum]|uniref:vWA domain-containing protein n=1 Tax=Desulfogranum japonicum TaxID=231447 RepID=UPI0003F6F20F|nr:VWA domain-containing protein [Desulfogranum japonicum]
MKWLMTGVLVFLVLLTGCSSQKQAEQEESNHTVTSDQAKPKEAADVAPQALIKQEEQATVASPSRERNASLARTAQDKAKMYAPAPMAGSVAGVVQPPAQWNRESYNAIQENSFINTANDPLSTFSIDVDTAGYANVRRMVTLGYLPPVGAVRIEEMINYFSYDYPQPESGKDFRLSAEVGPSPYHKEYRLVRIGLNAKDIDPADLPPSNLVFLVDVSGSMQSVNKLPLLKQAMKLLVEQMGSRDRIAIVAYAGSDRVVLQPTAANDRGTIFNALDQLRSGGSTHASSGIRTAYDLARQSFMPGCNNRVILASDGDFNVGVTSRGELQKLVEEERKSGIYLTVLGFGMGNYHDDTMEILADKGNGNYAYIDSLLEAKKVMVKEMSGTLFALANDVKIQVEFNPAHVGAYRLLGYENRALADEDFRDDTKDAGEIGVGHRVTALYELIPAGHASIPTVDPLKYQKSQAKTGETADELLTVKLRYKPLGKKSSEEMSLPVSVTMPKKNSADFQFAAAVAGYGMLLIKSDHLGTFTWEQCLQLAKSGRGKDSEGYRAEFYRLAETSELLVKQQPVTPSAPIPVRSMAK